MSSNTKYLVPSELQLANLLSYLGTEQCMMNYTPKFVYCHCPSVSVKLW